MSEKLSEKEKQLKHIKFLNKIGFLINYSDLDLYHGRTRSFNETQKWKVKTDFDNADNNSNNQNIMGIPCLCVASYDIAEAYAKGTSLDGRTGEMEVHKIVALDKDALIVNENFDFEKLSSGDKVKFNNEIPKMVSGALNKYVSSIKEDQLALFKLAEKYDKNKFYSFKDEEIYCQELSSQNISFSQNSIRMIMGAFNSNNLFLKKPVETSSEFVFSKNERRTMMRIGNKDYNLNQDLIKMIFKKNNIIGIKKKDRTVESKGKDIVYVFDLSKVQTAEKDSTEEMQ